MRRREREGVRKGPSRAVAANEAERKCNNAFATVAIVICNALATVAIVNCMTAVVCTNRAQGHALSGGNITSYYKFYVYMCVCVMEREGQRLTFYFTNYQPNCYYKPRVFNPHFPSM